MGVEQYERKRRNPSENVNSVIIHLVIFNTPVQIKTDNVSAYVSKTMKKFFAYYEVYYKYTRQSYMPSSYIKINSYSKGYVKKHTKSDDKYPQKQIA